VTVLAAPLEFVVVKVVVTLSGVEVVVLPLESVVVTKRVV